MCLQSNHIVLTESANGQVSWCKGCKNYSVIYNSCCFAFTDKELLKFKAVLEHLSPDDYHYHFLDDTFVIIKHERTNMGITLRKNETKQLIALLEESLTIKEVFSVLYQ